VDLEAAYARLAALEGDGALHDVDNLRSRISALNFLAEIADYADWRPPDEGWPTLLPRAQALRQRLTTLNEQLFGALRQHIRAGRYSRTELRRRFDLYTDYTPAQKGSVHAGPDQLDVLLDGVLGLTPPAGPRQPMPPEMNPYEPTPARAVLDLVDQVAWDAQDVFYDLGSGLGRVVILVHLLTGLGTKGVEIDPALCEQARHAAQRLKLGGIEFIQRDVREVDYLQGTVFFLFTPFKGSLWRAVLDRLRQQGKRRRLTLCTYGPCTFEVAREPWLHSLTDAALHNYRIALFQSR
jgi:SAM-dependent methyltransferase